MSSPHISHCDSLIIQCVAVPRPTPDVKLTETLGRIWNEYPGGMLDIKEEDIASRPPDDLAVEPTSKQDDEDVQGGMDGMMSLEDMEKLREEVLFQLK